MTRSIFLTCITGALVAFGCASNPAPESPAPSTSASAASSTSSTAASAAPIASAAPSTATATPSGPVFPANPGARFTFRGPRRDGTSDTWTTTITARPAGLVQYQPHHDIANWFSKGGFSVDASGVHVAGESMEGDPPNAPALAIAFPITAGAIGKVPGLFPTTYTVVAKESVTVPAGTFDAWRIDIKDPANPEGAVWIAPGTGVVKIKLPGGRIDELVSIDASGGASTPTTTTSSPASDTSAGGARIALVDLRITPKNRTFRFKEIKLAASDGKITIDGKFVAKVSGDHIEDDGSNVVLRTLADGTVTGIGKEGATSRFDGRDAIEERLGSLRASISVTPDGSGVLEAANQVQDAGIHFDRVPASGKRTATLLVALFFGTPYGQTLLH